MNRYARPGFVGGASSTNRASANTVCQKCLKKGHYSYECKAQAQERPYISRPSRSQQLLNPKLKPKLANIAPTPSDQETSSASQKPIHGSQRPQKRSLDDMDDYRPSRKRSRSLSSSSSRSVSTISTRSPSPNRPKSRHSASYQERDLSATGGASDKRRRRPSSSAASSSDHMQSYEANSRNTRMRRNSRSPSVRGRRRGRSSNSERRVRSVSGKNAKDGRGLTPLQRSDADGDNARPMLDQRTDLERADYNSRNQDREMRDVPSAESRPRSLSPFSKRLALTQAMNR